jgi:hypothetical protein
MSQSVLLAYNFVFSFAICTYFAAEYDCRFLQALVARTRWMSLKCN